MSKEEIKALIDAKIAGQGSAVDAGSALPAILNGILELAATPPARKVIEITDTFDHVHVNEALTKIKINGVQVSSFSELEPYLEMGTIIKHSDVEMEIGAIFKEGGFRTMIVGGTANPSFGFFCALNMSFYDDVWTFEYGEI